MPPFYMDVNVYFKYNYNTGTGDFQGDRIIFAFFLHLEDVGDIPCRKPQKTGAEAVQIHDLRFNQDIFYLKLYVFVQLLPSKQVYIERLFSHARWQAAAKTEHRMTDACTATVSYYG